MTQSIDRLIPISEFTATKQVKLFQTLKQRQLVGQLTMTSGRGEKWSFFSIDGEIVYATGGNHSVRRWRRNAKIYLSPEIASLSQLPHQMAKNDSPFGWEYEFLSLLAQEGKITAQQADNLIWAIAAEIFFDVTQADRVVCQFTPISYIPNRFTTVRPEEAIAKADQLWQSWRDAKVADRSPNLAPTIKKPELLKQSVSLQSYQQLTELLNGQNTLRDLAVYLKKDPLEVTRSFLHYIQIGWLEANEIPDLPVPEIASDKPPVPLIACVDDSAMFCHVLEQVVLETGYRFFSIQNPLNSIALLLDRQPDLLFLDVIMPHVNGYNICEQLRKHPHFRDIPIIFLTSNDGLIDRVKAKMVGASGFLSKNVDAATCIQQIEQHLKYFEQ
jgi:two-component system, chemotaxis family, response regulator PixG